MKTRRPFQQATSRTALVPKVARAFQVVAVALLLALLPPSLAYAGDDVDLGQVESITPDGKDVPDIVNYYQGDKGSKWHLWKRDDGTYYLKSGRSRADISAATVKTGLGTTYQIPDKTNNQGVDNFHNDVNSFIKTAIAVLPANAPMSGASFFPLNLSTALAMEGDNSGMWEDSFTKTFGVVGFEMVSNELSLLGSSTADGGTPVVYAFDASTSNWSLDVFGDTQFTFNSGTGPHAGEDYLDGWVFGTTPEPSSLLLLGSGVLGLSGLLRRRLHARS